MSDIKRGKYEKNTNEIKELKEKKSINTINKKRITDEFLRITEMDAVSFEERKVADYLIETLTALGFTLKEDDAGNKYQSDTGNLYAFKKGTIPGDPILFSAHMDTVNPGKNKKAILEPNGKIVSDGTTILGADDVSGIVAILEAIRVLEEQNIPHRDIELIFPIAEELYLKGSDVFDFSIIKAKEAYVLDLCGKIGTAAIQAPSLLMFELTVYGKAAHAGFAPEEGIHAIAIMSQIIAQIKQGRIDQETTLNIGLIKGGKGTNIVPELCSIKGEIRSFSHEKAVFELLEFEKKVKLEIEKIEGAEYELKSSVGCLAYKIESSEKVVERFVNACHLAKVEVQLVKTFGGSDNNNFVKHGIRGMVLACGMEQVHSCNEYTEVSALVASAAIVLELMKSRD